MKINLKKKLAKLLSSLWFLAFGMYATIGNSANLLSLDASSLPGDKVELKLVFDEPVGIPNGFTLDDLAQIALNFAGVKSNLANSQSQFNFNIGSVRTVRVLEMNNQMRIHVDLVSSKPYNTYTDGNNVYIVIGESAKTAVQSASDVEKKQIVKQVYGERTITNIDFRLGDEKDVRDKNYKNKDKDNIGNIIIELSDAKITPVIQDQANKILLNFANTQIPEELRLRLDVTDFNTAVRYISALNGNNNSTVTIELKGNYEHFMYQTENKLIVSVRQLSSEEETYKGNKVTFDFQNIEVKDALSLLISEAKDSNGNMLKNLVMTEGVHSKGSLFLKLERVPWDQAFKIITELKGLDYREEGNLLIVSPAGEVANYYQEIANSRRTISNLAPLKKEIIPLNYAQASDIVSLYEKSTQDTGEMGSLSTDERTNSIVANKTQAQLQELRDLIVKLDVPLRQVMIEAKVISIEKSAGLALGIKWQGGFFKDKHYVGGGSVKNIGDKDADLDSSAIIDLPSGSSVGEGASYGLTIGHINQSSILALRLNALALDKEIEIVSQPKVVTSDRTSAMVSFGQKVPYQELSATGGTTVKFQDVTVSLDVTPQITPDNQVMLQVTINNDEPVETPKEVPPIKKQEVNANVLIGNGETIVLGGLFTNNQNFTSNKIPILSDIPFIGRLFRSSTNANIKKEVLIFITPRIIDNKPI